MLESKSKVILTIEDYEQLKKLETDRIDEISSRNEYLQEIVNNDYIVQEAFLNTKYFKRSEGLLEITKDFCEKQKALKEQYEEKVNKIHLFRMMMTGTYIIMGVAFIILYFNR